MDKVKIQKNTKNQKQEQKIIFERIKKKLKNVSVEKLLAIEILIEKESKPKNTNKTQK